MAYKVHLSNYSAKKIQSFSHDDKASLTKALNLIETLGQIGYPLFLEQNIWRYKLNHVRIIYKIKGENMYVIDARNFIDDSVEKPDQYCFKLK